MTKHPILSIFLLLLLHSLSAQAQGFQLFGEINNADTLSKATLIIFGEGQVSQEEVAIVERKFKFEGSLTKPCLVVVNTDKVRGGLGIWLTPGLTKATFFVKTHGPTLRLLQTSTVDGPPEAMDYQKYMTDLNGYIANEKDLIKRKNLHWEYIQNYVTGHPESQLSIFMIRSGLQSAGLGQARTVYSKLSTVLASAEEGKGLLKEIEKVETNAIGKKITAFTLPDTSGQLMQIDSSSQRWTLLHFWASWCGPCRSEHKTMLSYGQMWAQKQVNIVGISLDEDKNDWLQAIKKDQTNWLQLSDLKSWEKSEVIKSFKVTSVPYSILLDENMTIKAVGMQNIIEKLKKM
jgi:thiol-disulfide isomerase/thioredoxin